MIRSMYSGISGLAAHQVKLDVVGNNIANVNTVAFKSSRALFKPQFYVTDSAGSPANGDFGGTNPSQRGLGATVATIEKDWTPGSIEPTGKATDMAIDGNGFFIVQGENQMFTRDGSFRLNSANQLVTSNGEFVQGFGVDNNYNIIPGQLQNIEIPLGAMTIADMTENVKVVGNLDASGDVGSGASILTTQDIANPVTGVAPDADDLLTDLVDAATGLPLFAGTDVITLEGTRGGRETGAAEFAITDPDTGNPRTLGDLMSFLQGNLGIDASITIPGTPAPGARLVNGTATTVQLAVVGNLGTENALNIPRNGFTNQNGLSPLRFEDGTDGTYTSDPAGESVQTSFVVYDSLGTPITVNLTAVMESKTDNGITWRFIATSADDTDDGIPPPTPDLGRLLGNGTLTFDNAGRLVNATNTQISLTRRLTGAEVEVPFTIDFSAMTSLTSRKSEMVMNEQDGAPMGVLDSFSVGADGKIIGSFTNGRTRTLGQLAMATFNNPAGLVDQGGNMFIEGTNSGVAVITSPLQLSAGAIRSGALELSNVDLSEQFINMIVSTTGFSASSRVISTSDRLIQELLNTSR